MQLISVFSDAPSHITTLILSILHLSASRCFADAVAFVALAHLIICIPNQGGGVYSVHSFLYLGAYK